MRVSTRLSAARSAGSPPVPPKVAAAAATAPTTDRAAPPRAAGTFGTAHQHCPSRCALADSGTRWPKAIGENRESKMESRAHDGRRGRWTSESVRSGRWSVESGAWKVDACRRRAPRAGCHASPSDGRSESEGWCPLRVSTRLSAARSADHFTPKSPIMFPHHWIDAQVMYSDSAITTHDAIIQPRYARSAT